MRVVQPIDQIFMITNFNFPPTNAGDVFWNIDVYLSML